MYPYEIIFGLGLYDIFLGAGIIAAMLCFAHFSKKLNFSAKFHNFVLFDGIFAVVAGYASAVLTQAVYNALDGDGFALNASTGATFLGGLVGGALSFIAVYFIGGAFVFPDKLHVRKFLAIADIASVAIPVAHGLGRLGCLMAGCCHGTETDAWYGIYHVSAGVKYVPVQLFEAVFLFALAALMFYRTSKKRINGLAAYMVCYGIWRYFAEYFRADDRGSTVVSFWSPSQLVSVLLIVGGAALGVSVYLYYKKKGVSYYED